MFSVLLIIKNSREVVALKQLFFKINAKVASCNAVYSSYLKSLQYDPDVVIMEIPAESRKEYCNFIRVIRTNKAIDQKQFIAYGDKGDESLMTELKTCGVESYLERPLDGKALIEEIRKAVKTKVSSNFNVDKNQTTSEEIELLKDPKVVASRKIEIMRGHVKKLFAFPMTVAEILRISQSDKGGASELAAIIKADPSVTTEILRIANSVHFSRGGKRILSIKDAIVRIGFEETKNIAMSISVFQIMKDKNYETGFSHTEYWFHCLGTALVAEMIARNSKLIEPEEAFIGGLLHDIGILLLNEFFNSIFLEILDKTTSEGNQFQVCEKQVLGFSHNEFVRELFGEWNFPDELVSSVVLFGKPESLEPSKIKEFPIASIITVADIIAKSLRIGREADCCVLPIGAETLAGLRLPYGFSGSSIDAVYNSMNIFNQALRIDNRSFPRVNDNIKAAEKVNLLCHSFSNALFDPVVEYLRVMRYNVVTVRDFGEVVERSDKSNVVIFTDVDNNAFKKITTAADLKVRVFSIGQSSIECENLVDNEFIPARMMLFDAGKENERKEIGKNSMVMSRFPVDLRNVDMALASLLNGCQIEVPLNELGAFKPAEHNLTIDGSVVADHKCLIAHAGPEIRKRFRDGVLSGMPNIGIEEANAGDIAYNLAKTMKEELSCIFIDLRIPVMTCYDVVKKIMELPNHKRAKFIIIYNKATREELLPFIKLGVRFFLPEDSVDTGIKKKLEEMQISRK